MVSTIERHALNPLLSVIIIFLCFYKNFGKKIRVSKLAIFFLAGILILNLLLQSSTTAPKTYLTQILFSNKISDTAAKVLSVPDNGAKNLLYQNFCIDPIVVKIVDSLLLKIFLKSPTTIRTTRLTNNIDFLLFAYDNIL